MNIAILLGTIRPNSNSSKVLQALISFAGKNYPQFNFTILDPADTTLNYNGYDRYSDTKYKQLTAQAEGFIIVSPEYNHSYPGFLKLMLDSAYDEYNYKPVFVVGVSDGRFGGARMIEHLIPVLKNFKMIVLNTDVPVPMADKTVVNGEFVDEVTVKMLHKAFTELANIKQLIK